MTCMVVWVQVLSSDLLRMIWTVCGEQKGEKAVGLDFLLLNVTGDLTYHFDDEFLLL